jgi:signal transduction histidine kinase
LLCGFRAWNGQITWALLALVVVGPGLALGWAWSIGAQSTDELTEIPLMTAMFVAMIWHGYRRKAAIAALRQVSEQNRAILERERTFVQNASHEFRTPITIALVHAELMQRSAEDAAGVRKDAQIIVDELSRLQHLVARQLLFTTADGAAAGPIVPIDLADFVADALRRWEPLDHRWLPGRGDEAAVCACVERLGLALDAVLENAVNCTDQNAPIEVSLVKERHTASIIVSDGGPGIPPADRESVFDRFVRGRTNGGRPNGFGLGLSLVRATVEAYGGTASAGESRWGGAEVTLRLPLQVTAPSHGRPSRESAQPQPSSRPGETSG